MNVFTYIFNLKMQNSALVAQLNGVKSGFVNVDNSVNKVNSTLNTLGQKIKGLDFLTLVTKVNAVADGLNSLSAPGLEFSTALADVSALTGVTGKALDELSTKARNSAKEFGGNAAASLENFKTILGRLGPGIAQNQEALSGMERNVQILSKTMGGDSAGAVDALTTAMLQFGVDLSDPKTATAEMTKMMDVMANAAQEGAAEVPQIAAALKVSGVAMKQAKVSFIEGNAAIQALAQGGKEGSEAGMALRNVLGKMAGEDVIPKEAASKLKALGVNMDVVSNTSLPLTDRLRELRKAQGDATVMAQVFGVENAASANILLSTIDAQDQYADKIGKVGGAMEQAAIAMNAPEEKMKRLQSRVDDFKISIFNGTDGLLGYSKVIGDVTRDITNMIPVYDLLTVSMSNGLKFIRFITDASKVSAFWSSIVAGATTAWSTAQWLLNLAMWANPIGASIAALIAMIALIGALVGGIISVVRHWASIKKAFTEGGLLEGLKRIGIVLLDVILAPIQSLLEMLAKIPGLSGLAGKGANKLADIRQNLNLVVTDNTKSATTKKAGILDPTIPGAILDDKSTTKDATKEKAAQTNEAIATGGTKNTTINISFKNMMENTTISKAGFKESVSEMEDQLQNALLRVLAMANTTAG